MNHSKMTTALLFVLAISFMKPGSCDSSEGGSSSSEEGGISGNCYVAFVCENAAPETISCTKKDRVLRIVEANYGRTVPDAQQCPYGNNHIDDTNCYAASSFGVVAGPCNGQVSCPLSANNGIFGDPCRGTYKYLRVVYCCKKPWQP